MSRDLSLHGPAGERPTAFAGMVHWWGAAVTFALAAFSVHVLQEGWTRYVRGEIAWIFLDFLWMAPLSYLAGFLALGTALGVLGIMVRPLRARRASLVTFTVLTVFGGLMLPDVFHPAACVVLAVGIGSRARPPRARQRWGMPRWALVLATPGLFLGVTGGLEALSRPWRERRALAGLPPPSEGAPNVLLLILDTVRAANLSVYGYARPTTPAMERVAAEGALFLDAYATAPWTLPSHTSLFTGLLPGQADADWTVPLGDQPATLAEVLRSQGFATAGFVANPIYTQRETGLSRGFIHYSTSRRSLIQLAYSNAFAQIGVMRRAIQRRDLREIIRSLDRNTARIGVAQASHRKPAFLVVDEFLAWLATAGPDRPFFAFLNLFDAHAPYLNTDPERFQHLEAATPGRRGLYDAAIASQDAHVGRLLDSLKVRGILDRTLVIVASDHGELFGEHDLHGHGNSLYRQVLHVPLLLRYPARIQAGTRVRRPVSIRDVPVTVLDILAQERGEWQGRSLLSSTAGMARQRQGRAELQVPMAVAEVSGNPDLGGDGAPAHEGDIRSIFGYGLHLIVGPRGESQLYEYMRDTAELNDLVGHPAYRDREATLRRFLDSVPSRLEPTASVRGRGGR